MIFGKGAKTIQRGKDDLFNRWCCKNWIATCRRIKFDSYTKINSKWMKDLNIRAKTIRSQKDAQGKNLPDTGFGNKFLYIIQETQTTKEKIEKLDFFKIKNF